MKIDIKDKTKNNKNLNGNEYYVYYYITDNKELGVGEGFKIQIDPEFKGDLFFEYGRGFYLTPSKEVIIEYAKFKCKDSEIDKILNNNNKINESRVLKLESLLNGIKYNQEQEIYDYNKDLYLHIFKSKNPIINDLNIKVNQIEYSDEKFKKNHVREVAKSLLSYIDNYYKSDVDITYGPIIGSEWDSRFNLVDKNGKNTREIDFIKDLNFMNDLFNKKVFDTSKTQLVIHKRNIKTSEWINLFNYEHKTYKLKNLLKEVR